MQEEISDLILLFIFTYLILVVPFLLPVKAFFKVKSILFSIIISFAVGILILMITGQLLLGVDAYSTRFLVGIYFGIALFFNLLLLLKRPIPIKISIPKHDWLFYVFIFILVVGVLYRIYDNISRFGLGAFDPWTHFNIARALDNGVWRQTPFPIFYERDYHFVLCALHYCSGVNLYNVVRFTGPIWASLFLVSAFLIGYELEKRITIGVLIVAFLAIPSFFNEEIIRSHLWSWREGFAYVLLPIVFICGIRLITKSSDGSLTKKDIFLFSILMISLGFAHNLTTLFSTTVLLCFFLAGLFFYPQFRKVKKISIVLFLFSIGLVVVQLIFLYAERVLGGEKYYGLTHDTSTGTSATTFRFNILPESSISPFNIVLLILTIIIFLMLVYFGRKISNYSYVAFGFSFLIIGYIETTDSLFPLPWSIKRLSSLYILLFSISISLLIDFFLRENRARNAISRVTAIFFHITKSIRRSEWDEIIASFLIGVIAGTIISIPLYRSEISRISIVAFTGLVFFFATVIIFGSGHRINILRKKPHAMDKMVIIVIIILLLVPPPKPIVKERLQSDDIVQACFDIERNFDRKDVDVYTHAISIAEERIIGVEGNVFSIYWDLVYKFNSDSTVEFVKMSDSYLFSIDSVYFEGLDKEEIDESLNSTLIENGVFYGNGGIRLVKLEVGKWRLYQPEFPVSYIIVSNGSKLDVFNDFRPIRKYSFILLDKPSHDYKYGDFAYYQAINNGPLGYQYFISRRETMENASVWIDDYQNRVIREDLPYDVQIFKEYENINVWQITQQSFD